MIDHTRVHSHGYLMRGRRYVHRIVAEKMLGRPLRPRECVHHENGDRTDNRPENLVVYDSHSEHMKAHREEFDTWAAEGDALLVWCRRHGFSIPRTARLLGQTTNAIENRSRRLRRRGDLECLTPGRKSGGPPNTPRWLEKLCIDTRIRREQPYEECVDVERDD